MKSIFDRLTRRAALKGGIGALAAGLALGIVERVSARQAKVDVCHWDEGAGEYELITIAQSGWNHGHAYHENDFLASDVDFNTDPDNCGGCGIFCEGGECVEGLCVDDQS